MVQTLYLCPPYNSNTCCMAKGHKLNWFDIFLSKLTKITEIWVKLTFKYNLNEASQKRKNWRKHRVKRSFNKIYLELMFSILEATKIWQTNFHWWYNNVKEKTLEISSKSCGLSEKINLSLDYFFISFIMIL